MDTPFNPDIRDLLFRPRIELPREEFEFTAPDSEPVQLPTAPDLAAPQDLRTHLLDEAGRMQELIDLLIETTEPVGIELDPDELADPQLNPQGWGKLYVEDYFRDVQSPDPEGHRRRKRFEQGLLDGGCAINFSWPVLALGDMVDLRDTMLSAANMLEGQLLADVQEWRHQQDWQRQMEGSQLAGVYGDMAKGSAQYRSKFARTVATMYRDLRGPFLRCLLSPAVDGALNDLRRTLEKLCELLKQIRAILCHLMLLRMLAYKDVREALATLVKHMLVSQLIQLVGALLDQVLHSIVAPVYGFLSEKVGDDCFVAAVGEQVSAELVGAIGEGVVALHEQYTNILSDLYRQSAREMQARLDGLQKLGERNTLGRWVRHLDKAIDLCEHLHASDGATVAGELLQFMETQLEPPDSKLLDRLGSHPEYRVLLDAPLEMHTPLREPRTGVTA